MGDSGDESSRSVLFDNWPSWLGYHLYQLELSGVASVKSSNFL